MIQHWREAGKGAGVMGGTALRNGPNFYPRIYKYNKDSSLQRQVYPYSTSINEANMKPTFLTVFTLALFASQTLACTREGAECGAHQAGNKQCGCNGRFLVSSIVVDYCIYSQIPASMCIKRSRRTQLAPVQGLRQQMCR